jgi:hypothetical protein
MALLVEGTDGLVRVGPSNHPTVVGYVTEFTVTCETEITERGPYIGDATIRKTRKAKTSSGSLSADLPEGLDPGQTKLVEAHETGANVEIYLRGGGASDGMYYRAANAAVSGVEFSGTADEGYSTSFNFTDMDGYTLDTLP